MITVGGLSLHLKPRRLIPGNNSFSVDLISRFVNHISLLQIIRPGGKMIRMGINCKSLPSLPVTFSLLCPYND
ncbi:hypothetical protein Barb7_01841 [Bacteroidales bacterium Barb7]|nr:hypothetical protein Barb7_01841 [Bacteroidales bacterium Barb7]